MKTNRRTNIFSFLLLLLLIAAIALTAVGCDEKKDDEASSTTTVTTTAATTAAATDVGEGAHSFMFEVVHLDGRKVTFNVKTDKTLVGEALVELGIISGEDGQYGLYVKTVDGETLDYDTHKKYWAFYVDGAYALSGVDTTAIEDGKVYGFRAE
ncbi:MAG: DUF4430 domain-containing protein [Ruminococcaceae bacterium]|nr:DUF4430 domain-containing protein [Oscillospiraceae bacterium]